MVSEYAYTPWGGRILLSGVNITDRGYTGHEHLSPFGDDTNSGFCLINMNGRIYDPVLARFLSPDPYVQAPDFTQSFNRYSYCSNNPFKYTDPSGELQLGPFYASLNIGWSPNGGLSLGVSAGVGIEGWLYAGIGVNYGFKNSNWSFTGNVGAFGSYAYGGYDTKAGWIGGAGWAAPSPFAIWSPISINSNLWSAGVSYSQNGGWSANAAGFTISASGINFDPSVGMSVNFRWGTASFEHISDEKSDGQLDNGKFDFQSDYELNQFVDEYINKSDYGIIELTAFKDNFGAHEGKYSEYSYFREKNGIIYKVGNTGGSKTRIEGVTFAKYSGLKTYSSIYMSRITNRNGFIKTLNHEITHAFHNYKGYRNGMSTKDYRKFTESSAYFVSDGGLPKTSFHSQFRNGIYRLIIPPRLIPVPIF